MNTDNDMLRQLPPVRFRAVEPDDARFLFEIENDESAWEDSDTLAPYSFNLLREYAENYKADPLSEGQLRLVALDISGNPVGLLDFYDISFVHNTSYIGIYVHPGSRRKGYAASIINQAISYARRRLNLNALGAKILSHNSASISLFEKAGFSVAGILPQWRRTLQGRSDLILMNILLGE